MTMLASLKLRNFKTLNGLICTLLICLFGGCTPTQYHPNSKITLAAKEQAEKYQQLASKAQGDQAISYKLHSVEQMILADDIEHAQELLKNAIPKKLNANNSALKQILLAQISLAQQDLEQAKEELKPIWTPHKLPENLQVKFFSTRAEIYRRTGNLVEAVQERIYLSKHLHETTAQTENNYQIWDILSQLTPNTLKTVRVEGDRTDLNAWVSFASITKQYDSNPQQLLHALAAWKQKYPQHPAISFVPPSIAETMRSEGSASDYLNSRQNVNRPHKIALMLPLQGSHAKSAQAIRDGFLAAFYVHKDDPNKPSIQIYDTTQTSLQALYRQIVDDGADFIVGPLMKEEVDELSAGVRPQVPILALNTTSKGQIQENVYQFSLSPEMEAQAVAKKAWQDGHRHALIIIPKSAWGERMRSAFQEHWTEMGGSIVGVAEISSQSKINKELQHLLGVDKSEQRANQVRELGIRVSAEPRRRQDLDMVFIATNAALARQVKPLLNFYYAGNIPAYASSSVFSGKMQPGLDQDLNGVQFCDMPWLLDNSLEGRAAHKEVAKLMPHDFDQYARLYALGLDAYKIAMQMEQMNMLPDLGISGMTGMLTIDNQQIQRKLTWAAFRRGIPHVTGNTYE